MTVDRRVFPIARLQPGQGSRCLGHASIARMLELYGYITPKVQRTEARAPSLRPGLRRRLGAGRSAAMR